MPKVRDLLIHVSVETAQRKRRCHRTSNDIVKGEACLVIKTGSMGSPQSYEVQSARQILDHAHHRLLGLYAGLGLTPPQ